MAQSSVKRPSRLAQSGGRPPFNWNVFLLDNITGSRGQTIWIALLTLVTLFALIRTVGSRPLTAILIFAVWAISVGLTMLAEIKRTHNTATIWLKENMYTSVSNMLITLLLSLVLGSALVGLWGYAVTNASWSLDPAVAQEVTQSGEIGARWGAVRENIANLMVFRMKGLSGGTWTSDNMVRVWTSFGLLAALIVASVAVFRNEKTRGTIARPTVTWGWVFSIYFIIFFILRGAGDGGLTPTGEATTPFKWAGLFYAAIMVAIGIGLGIVKERFLSTQKSRGASIAMTLLTLVQYTVVPIAVILLIQNYSGSGRFYKLDIDQIWGGYLLTVLITVFSVIVSFPFGVLLALGRRSKVNGIPWWITYPLAGIATIYLLATGTPYLFTTATTTLGKVLAFWPVLVPIAAYGFQRSLKGNVIATFCTLYIEMIRGVPLITLLFMSLVLFPIFLPTGVVVLNVWRVMAAFTMFSAAYLAENVRGGLQAIPRGQYEAADSLGLSTFNKYTKIVLPQAIRIVIPAIVGQFIGIYKDTSLVYLVGLFDFLRVANVISSQPAWLTIRTEPYIFLFIVYFIGSGIMAWYSRRLERQLAVGQR